MVVADFVTIAALVLVPCFIGYKWGVMERVASDYIEESMK